MSYTDSAETPKLLPALDRESQHGTDQQKRYGGEHAREELSVHQGLIGAAAALWIDGRLTIEPPSQERKQVRTDGLQPTRSAAIGSKIYSAFCLRLRITNLDMHNARPLSCHRKVIMPNDALSAELTRCSLASCS